MGIHVLGSKRLIRARRLFGGVMVGCALALAAPVGLAFAAEGDGTEDNPVDTRGDANPIAQAVGRPNFNGAPGSLSPAAGNNPAPLVRATQAVGDTIFNQNNAVNGFIDDTFGQPYHRDYGYKSTGLSYENPDFNPALPVSASNPQFIVDAGSNGQWQGVLNNGAFYNLAGGSYDLAQEVGVPLPSEGGLVPKGATVTFSSGNTKLSGNSVIGAKCVTKQEASCPQ